MAPSIQFKVDIHSVGPAGNQVFGWGINPVYPTGGGEHAFIHYHITRRANDRKVADPAVGRDGDFQGRGELGRTHDAGWLLPETEEPVVNHFVIPSEVRAAGGAGLAANRFGFGN